jgi:hypothetical protein
MRRKLRFVVLGVLLSLSMGSTCDETAQSALSAFFTELVTEIAESTGEAIGDGFVERTTP